MGEVKKIKVRTWTVWICRECNRLWHVEVLCKHGEGCAFSLDMNTEPTQVMERV